MKFQRTLVLFTAALGLLSFAATARANMDGACKEDMKKFCGDVKHGDGRMMDCMKTHEAEFSQTCKDNMAKHKEKMHEMRQEVKAACEQDIKQFCANVTPGEGRELACLKSYEDKISAGCKEKLPQHHGMHKKK